MIYVNGRFLTRPMTGVERYAYMVCKALAERGERFTIVCPKGTVALPCYDVTAMTVVYYGRGRSHVWEQCVLPFFFVGKKDYLLFNFTGLGPVAIGSKVMTIHDLSFLENPKWFSLPYYLLYKLLTPIAARTSRHIITVSQFSKREILRFYPFIREEKISVVYCAADRQRFRRLDHVAPPTEPFALAVSSLDPRKNFARLVEAFEGMDGYRLYIVGSKGRVFTGSSGSSSTSSNITFLGRVSDDELLRLYNQATCFVFPSVYEGFGLPPLEAMQCGCPVLAADIPVVHEVCGDAAEYFDPYDVESIRRAVRDFFARPDNDKAAMRQRGYDNARRFSWSRAGEEILAIKD